MGAAFLNRADSLSAADAAALRLVNALSAGVLHTAAMMTDMLEVVGPWSHNDKMLLKSQYTCRKVEEELTYVLWVDADDVQGRFDSALPVGIADLFDVNFLENHYLADFSHPLEGGLVVQFDERPAGFDSGPL